MKFVKKIYKYLDSEKQGQSLYPPVYTSSIPTPMQSGGNQGSNLPYPSSPPQYNQAPMNPPIVITQQPSIIHANSFYELSPNLFIIAAATTIIVQNAQVGPNPQGNKSFIN